MTTSSYGSVETLQREVQRLLGRCLLRLQQCERLAKAIVAHHEMTGPVHTAETVRAERVATTAGKTFGTLVGELLSSYVDADANNKLAEETMDYPEDIASISFKMTLRLSDTDFARTESEMRELVRLRNDLVHHFIEKHDISSSDGCRGAQKALQDSYSRIDQGFDTLRGWVECMTQTQRLAAEIVQSDEFHDLMINGVAPDGTVHWPAAGIVCALREAAEELAVKGWTPLGEAENWISERYPEQTPSKYGCRSWPQVLHESRNFELHYFELNGQRSAWYRGREFHNRKPA